MSDFFHGVNHGLDWSNPYLAYWFIGCPVANIILCVLFRQLGWFKGDSRFGTKLCDVAAFLAVAFFCVTYLGFAGLIAFTGFNGNTVYDDLKGDDMRIHGRSDWVENHLVYPMIGYQIWNLLASCCMNEFRGVQMIVHHVLTGSLAYFGLYPYVHFQGLFFFGLTEITNVPLTFVDFFKQFKDYAEVYPNLYSASRMVFGVSFIVLRLIMWPYRCYGFWKDSLHLLISGEAHSNFVVGFFLMANILLTGLQFVWGKEIIKAVMGMKKDSKKRGAKKTA
jgi:hypothetical protein